MLEKRNIIYFKPFYFSNGTSKPKFFLVLGNSEGKRVLATLPTSRDNVPESSDIKTGCVELPEINFNCYVILPNIPVTENRKSFSVKTHVYGQYINEYDSDVLMETYPIENIHYQVWGKMNQDVFNEVIQCLKNSKMVRRKFKRILETVE